MLKTAGPADMTPLEYGGYKFVQDYWDHKAKEPPFLADVAKIDASWAQSKQFYIGENGTGNAIKTRYPDFKKWLSEHPDTPIIMPNVSWSESFKQIQFGNGRHRFAVFRDMGFKKLWVSIPKKPT